MPAKGRIDVQCPHCGNIQLEPELAKSTYRKNMQRLLSAKRPDSKQARPSLCELSTTEPDSAEFGAQALFESLGRKVENSGQIDRCCEYPGGPYEGGGGKDAMVLSDCQQPDR